MVKGLSFIKGPSYGTICHYVLLQHHDAAYHLLF